MTFEKILNDYLPSNEQEEKDKDFFIKSYKTFGDILTRQNEFCHVTSSAFVINKERTKVLCIYHNIYDSWGWTGGHADGEGDLEFVAKKEVREETSVQNLKPLLNSPVTIQSLAVDSHLKRGKYISSHIHLDFTYLFEADEKEALKIKEDENSNVAWLTFDELLEKSTEPNMIKVYKKIIEKIKNIKP